MRKSQYVWNKYNTLHHLLLHILETQLRSEVRGPFLKPFFFLWKSFLNKDDYYSCMYMYKAQVLPTEAGNETITTWMCINLGSCQYKIVRYLSTLSKTALWIRHFLVLAWLSLCLWLLVLTLSTLLCKGMTCSISQLSNKIVVTTLTRFHMNGSIPFYKSYR